MKVCTFLFESRDVLPQISDLRPAMLKAAVELV